MRIQTLSSIAQHRRGKGLAKPDHLWPDKLQRDLSMHAACTAVFAWKLSFEMEVWTKH